MSPPNVVILARVSTHKQSTDRQEAELQAEADKRGWKVVEILTIKISGRADAAERTDLDRVRELAKGKKIHKVLTHEISRISRKNSIIHKFVEDLSDCGVSLYWHSQRIETLLESGKTNPAAHLMLALLGELARSETETIRERVTSGLANAKANGVILGRRKGDSFSREKFLSRYPKAVELLGKYKTVSVRDLAKMAGIATKTAHRVTLALGGGEWKR